MMLKFLPLMFLLSFTAVAEDCQYQEDFYYNRTMQTWRTNLITPKTYVSKVVSSTLGNFSFQVVGGTHQEQLMRWDQYVCTIQGTWGPNDSYRYSDEVAVEFGEQSEQATEATVTFPNGFVIKADREKLTAAGHELRLDGIKSIGPFTPAGALPIKDAILIVGKLNLDKADYVSLKAVLK